MLEAGTLISDRYRIVRPLGQGGMGHVYLAEHVRMGRKSALKVMNPALAHDPDAVGRFNREAENASRINHPNVAAVYDFGETPDRLLFLAMEFVEGESLSAVIAREGALRIARAVEIARQAAEGLRVAHRHGIVHRDLKPDNIMLTRDLDDNDLVKVVDFGIAKAMASEAQQVTRTGLSVGTPEYMSPEQLSGEPVDFRSDIYSLGLVTFHMLTGVLPFPAVTTREALVRRLVDQPATLAAVRPDVAWPPELQTVLDRALASKPNARYQDAGELGRALAASLAARRISRPTTTPLYPPVAPPPDAETSSGWAWPSWAMLGLLALVVVLGVVLPRRFRERANRPAATLPADTSAAAAAPAAPAVAPIPTPAEPAAPARVPSLADSIGAVRDDVAVMRAALQSGSRADFQAAQAATTATLARLIQAHPRDPAVSGLASEVGAFRDSVIVACRRDPAPCVAVGAAIDRSPAVSPRERLRQRRDSIQRARGRGRRP